MPLAPSAGAEASVTLSASFSSSGWTSSAANAAARASLLAFFFLSFPFFPGLLLAAASSSYKHSFLISHNLKINFFLSAIVLMAYVFACALTRPAD